MGHPPGKARAQKKRGHVKNRTIILNMKKRKNENMKERTMNGRNGRRKKKLHDNVRKKAGSTCSRMSAALVHSTYADNWFALDTSARAHSDIRTIYADTVEHARLFKSISIVQRYSLQRSMRANMRSAPCAASGIMA